MSKARKKTGKKDKKDNGSSSVANKSDEAQTTIATLIFSQNSLTKQLIEEKQNYFNLKQNSDEFRHKFEKKIEEQQEIILFLEKTISDMKANQKSLHFQIKSEMKYHHQTKSDLSKIQMNLKSEFTSNTKHLRQQISKLNEELKDLHDFKQKKHNIESELNSTKDALTKEKHERENREAFLGRRFLSERERLKKEMLNKIRETKLHLLEMTENQLHTTTKRTIMENEQMTIELQYQSKETEKLLKSNLQNIDLNMNLQRHIKLHKKVEKMLATRTYFLQKLVEQLHNELKKKENDKQISNQHNTQLQLQLQQIQNTMNAENNGSRNRNKRVHTSDAHKMHDKLKSVQVSDRNGTKIGSSYSQQRVTSKDVQKSEQKGYKRGQIEIKKLKRDLAVAQKTYQSFLNLQSEAVTFIWTCLEDVKCSMKQKIKDSQSAVNERDIKKYDKKLSLDEMSMNDRQWMLEKLLEKLTAQNAHAFIDLGLEQEMDNGKKDSNVNIETRDMLMYRTPSELALMN